MTTLDRPRPALRSPAPPSPAIRPPWWLRLSVPIGFLGIAASLAGILVDRVYADETPNWQAQAVGQDIANLVVLPVLLVLAYAAARGSRPAALAWAGTVVYAAYAYAIYAFAVHFGPLFLVYVAVLGASVWALGGFLTSEASTPVRPSGSRLTRFASLLLLGTAALFALMWVAQDLPAMVDGTRSQELQDTGLLTNPVHVLDLAFFLPASALAGVLLRRGSAWGARLAPIVLTAMASISLGILTLMVVSAARDLDASPVVAAVIGVLGIVQAATAWLLVRGQRT
ncbi:hypothetical protein [Nocardioides pocheonensis]|uniref:Uncharacterized protein n=1 Tax=Nocardioides pocheonensis TaxID=661485 RepID=A0A3N0GJQ3_9ACTN|nr:hypothetical protein [Nocardioides pocheonensis]RNM12402.1 hypothetical protein EFL26_17270 [Nocardioides pocheonensis]